MSLEPGQILNNRYQITALLGHGGMGSVYRAHDQTLNRAVAIKERRPDPNATTTGLVEARAQFQREAQVLANLNHPNLPRVTDFFSSEGNEYLVMDFVEGGSLERIVQQRGAQLETLVLAWAQQLLDALIYIHARNMVHRDIKPQNLILTTEGRVVLVDFGLVKLFDPNDPRTVTAMRGMGTAEYAPLEQFSPGMHTDARSDIYGLGATLYHLLTGHPPPDVPRRLTTTGQLAPLRAIDPGISPQMEWVVQRAMEVHPQNRFQSAWEMRQAFTVSGRIAIASSGMQAQPVPAYAAAPAIPIARPLARPWVFPTVAAIVILLGFALGALGLVSYQVSRGTFPVSTAMPFFGALAPTATSTATPTPTSTPTPTAIPTSTSTPTRTPTPTPTRTPTPTPALGEVVTNFGVTLVGKPSASYRAGVNQCNSDLATPMCWRSDSTDPIEVFRGKGVHFLGTQVGGQELIARYHLHFDVAVQLSQIDFFFVATNRNYVDVYDAKGIRLGGFGPISKGNFEYRHSLQFASTGTDFEIEVRNNVRHWFYIGGIDVKARRVQ